MGDTLDPTQNHHGHQGCHHQTGIGRVKIKGALQAIGHRVSLHSVTDAEPGQHAEQGEQDRQPGKFGAKAMADVVHRAANILTVAVLLAKVHRQNRLAVLGCNANQSDQPHPHQSARSTQCDGRSHPGNVAGANGGRHGSGQCGVAGNGAFTAGSAKQLAKAKAEPANRQEAQSQGQPDACATD